MTIWRRMDHRLFELGRQVSGHAVLPICLALTALPFLLALVIAWFGFAIFAALGLHLPGFLAVCALLFFLWRHVYTPVIAPMVAHAADGLKARDRAHGHH
jgi:hypothetical protein